MKYSRRTFNHILSMSLASLAASSTLPHVALAGQKSHSKRKQKIVIVGGGSSGVYCAWLLGKTHNVTLLEQSDVLGGHAMTKPLTVFGQSLEIDLGAQYFSDGAYPKFSNILRATGQSHLAHKFVSDFVMQGADKKVALLSPNLKRFLNPEYLYDYGEALLAFGRFHHDIEKTVPKDQELLGHWFEKTHISHKELNRVIRPVVAAIGSRSLDVVDQESAGIIIGYIKGLFPHGLSIVPHLKLFRGGLQPVIQQIAKQSQAHIVSNFPVSQIQHSARGWRVFCADGRSLECDQLILSCPPWRTAAIQGLPTNIGQQMSQVDHMQTPVVIHTDRSILPKNSNMWAYNIFQVQDSGHMLTTQWIGRELVKNKRLPLFKTLFREGIPDDIDPAQIQLQHLFTHVSCTLPTVVAQQRIKRRQGENNMWFCNASLYGYDCQESAVRMAIDVASQLAPDSPNLRALTG